MALIQLTLLFVLQAHRALTQDYQAPIQNSSPDANVASLVSQFPPCSIPCIIEAQEFYAAVTACEVLNCSPTDYTNKQQFTSRICSSLYTNGTLNSSSVSAAVASATAAAVQATSTADPANYLTYPPCARNCVTQALQLDCGTFNNTQCVCQNPIFGANVTVCERSTCSATDLQTAASLAEANCNRPGVGGVGDTQAQLAALNATLGGPGQTQEQLTALNATLTGPGNLSVTYPAVVPFTDGAAR
ncbi:MAG: hypothetical protein Q9179_005892, partial [Wetmoreana sp. 5 TL-2023]